LIFLAFSYLSAHEGDVCVEGVLDIIVALFQDFQYKIINIDLGGW
jgi:hypothetical protein